MRKIYLMLSAVLLIFPCYAQEMVVGAGAELYISPKTDLYISGLTLTPSTNFTISDRSIQQDTVVTHTFNNTYVRRTYTFSDTTLFSGSIQINYLDADLDTLSESSLQVSVYNGSTWQAAGTSTVNGTENYVRASGISGLPVGELILANSIPLSLEWGDLSAARQGQSVTVKWYTMYERNITHFDVERSSDGIGWTTAIAGIPARNNPVRTDYEQTDKPGHYGRVYYRIKQTDADGRFTFSKTVVVEMSNSPIVLSPNPADKYFRISGMPASDIQKIELVNTTGAVVRSWKGNQLYFDLSGLSSGVYYLKIKVSTGSMVNLPLSIR